MHRTLLLLVLLTLVPAAASAEPETPKWKKEVDAVANAFIDAGVVQSAVVGIIDGEREHVIAYGQISAKRPTAPDAETIYEIGSITKVFTALMLASLVEEGAVKLDQPVAELLPEGVIMPARATDDGRREITLTDLATHSSGLPYMPSNFNPPDPERPYEHYTREALYTFLSAHMLRRMPASKYEYSNLATGLLAHALGLQAKQTYPAMLRARITKPLGLTATHVTTPQAVAAQVATPHNADGVPTEPWDFATLAGAGAIRSNMRDMLKFARANLKPDGSAMGKALKRAQQIHWQPDGSDRGGMGLGWHSGPGTVRWHNGQTGGYHSFIQIDPDKSRAVVVLSNTATGQVDRMAHLIGKALQGGAVSPPKFRVPVELTAAQLEACTGTYEITPLFKLTVTVADGRLMAQGTGQPKLRLWPSSPTEFFVRAVEARVTFKANDDGKMTGLVLHQNGADMPGKRID